MAAKGLDDVVYLTVGIGIGAGVLVNGNCSMLHPEAGHIEKNQTINPWSLFCPFMIHVLPALWTRYSEKDSFLANELIEKDEGTGVIISARALYLCTYYHLGGVMNQKQLFSFNSETA